MTPDEVTLMHDITRKVDLVQHMQIGSMAISVYISAARGRLFLFH